MSPTSILDKSRSMYGSTLSFNAFSPSRINVQTSNFVSLKWFAYLLKVDSDGISSQPSFSKIYLVKEIALLIVILFG